jgi:hypothetical protein
VVGIRALTDRTGRLRSRGGAAQETAAIAKPPGTLTITGQSPADSMGIDAYVHRARRRRDLRLPSPLEEGEREADEVLPLDPSLLAVQFKHEPFVTLKSPRLR